MAQGVMVAMTVIRAMAVTLRRLAALAPAATMLACNANPAPPLPQEAYVWQHAWGTDTIAAVAQRPTSLRALRVLGAEVAAGAATPKAIAVDLASLAAAGPLSLVVRVDGARLSPKLSLASVAELARRWQAAGVHLRDIEVDHDCATAALPTYTAWLQRQRAHLDGRTLAITALPTWSDAPAAAAALVRAVDRVTLQVHSIRAPTLFDADAAWRDATRWAKATRYDFWLALPTYRARLRTGAAVAAEPTDVAAFVRRLRAEPIEGVAGLVYFRLAYRDDPDAWSAQTLDAVATAVPLRANAHVALVKVAPQLWNIEVAADGNTPSRLPPVVALAGRIEALEGVNGCWAVVDGLRCADVTWLHPGQRRVLGYVRGEEVTYGTGTRR